ncbi:MAG: RluA family pseudouridine synthase [Parachlamydiales bacterium]|jgi:23S rRNA pseudouridine955/2504/2580 synthase/23S rRNA pseudouridine1911/1915/1917 synthase
MAFKTFQVLPAEAGARLVNFLKLKTLCPLSLRSIKRALEKGICRLNGKVECFASTILKAGDLIEIDLGLLPEAKAASARPKETFSQSKKVSSFLRPEVLFEDDFYLIIDKPVDFLSSDKAVRNIFPKTVLVHRLDLKTSGVLVLAKSELAKTSLMQLFEKQKVKKVYLAVLDGYFNRQKGRIESFLKQKQVQGKILFSSHPSQGEKAITEFETVFSSGNYSVVVFFPLTGRTHQLRVHALELGHPILGDYQYAQRFIYPHLLERLFLHSWKIEFKHPFTRQSMQIEAPIPEPFKKFLKHAHFDY